MIDFEIGYSISKKRNDKRRCGIGVFFKNEKSLLLDINSCSYSYLSEVVFELNKILTGESIEFEWGGGERAWFISKKDTTIIEDNFKWVKNIVLPTYEIYNILVARKSLIEKNSKEKVVKIVVTAFNKIKSARFSYLDNESTTRYSVKDTDNLVVIKMVLTEEELLINEEEFRDSLCFNEKYFFNKTT